jgi:hypothetical protein
MNKKPLTPNNFIISNSQENNSKLISGREYLNSRADEMLRWSKKPKGYGFYVRENGTFHVHGVFLNRFVTFCRLFAEKNKYTENDFRKDGQYCFFSKRLLDLCFKEFKKNYENI